MYTNGDCTLYVAGCSGYRSIYVPACYMQDISAAQIKKYGADIADSVKVIIPQEHCEGLDKLPREGVYIVKGAPDVEITDSIEPLITADIPLYAVTSVTAHFSGSVGIRHITICGK